VRDDFSSRVRHALARRAADRCSNPDCGAVISGPALDPDLAVIVGVAAHITAASPGGPRYDAALSGAERAAGANGIWLCQTCSKLIDSDLEPVNDRQRFLATCLSISRFHRVAG
jgi:ribosomal protein L37AE/L43A